MAGQREDYMMRIAAMMAEMLRRISGLREAGSSEQALALIIVAQEKLFQRPVAAFAALDMAEQLRLLALDEPAEQGRAKQLAYAATLREAGLIYEARSRADAAVSAFQLALYILLFVAADDPARQADLRPQIRALLAAVPPEQLFAPTLELLKRFPVAGGG